MLKNFKILAFALLIFVVSANVSSAQTCGFGCLGLGGFYAGYAYQKFETDELNQRILGFNSAASEFGAAKGFRLGANLFRTKYKNFLFTFKGYYQFLNQNNSTPWVNAEEPFTIKHSLDINYWGVGFDTGINLLSFMDFKAIDAQITFHNAKMTVTTITALEESEDVFRSRKTNLGFQLGSGLIFHLAGDYISLETTAAYSIFSVGQVENENGLVLQYSDMDSDHPIEEIVEKGGLNLLIQLNVGIPLY